MTGQALRAVDPPYDSPGYRSTALRAPRHPLVPLAAELVPPQGPVFGPGRIGSLDYDLTRQHQGEPLGERIVVTGSVRGSDGRPVRGQLVEVWQANAAGRYAHRADQHAAPLDPNFSGAGRCLTDSEGVYRFVTIKPGAYCWQNHHNAWRPAHIHFSLFGSSFTSRLITQMYFPGDPLLALDPIIGAIPDARARERLIAGFDLAVTEPQWALGYRFDIVLDGPGSTPLQQYQ